MSDHEKHVHQESFPYGTGAEHRIDWQAIRRTQLSEKHPLGLPLRLHIVLSQKGFVARNIRYRPVETVRIVLGEAKAPLPELKGKIVDVIVHTPGEFSNVTREHSARLIGSGAQGGFQEKVARVLKFLFP
jgi:hypothetical protein